MSQLFDGQLITVAEARLLFQTGALFRARVQCFFGDMHLLLESRVGTHKIKTARGEQKVYKSLDKLNFDFQLITNKTIETFEITLPMRG